jgi:16S rRNA (uracil1498-N3)-methyltransferase
MPAPPPRFFADLPLACGVRVPLPPGPSRHVQVLRLQPGAPITLFDGRGGEWSAQVAAIGRADVTVDVGTHDPVERELACHVTLALGMPANERMDTLVEKATELGVARIQPLVCERSVLRLSGERAERKCAHWQGIAVAASEQSGRTRVPEVAPVRTLRDWLAAAHDDTAVRCVLSLRDGARPFRAAQADTRKVFLSGPEGGLSEAEETLAIAAGFTAVSLGARTLRADTAPLAVLAALALSAASA